MTSRPHLPWYLWLIATALAPLGCASNGDRPGPSPAVPGRDARRPPNVVIFLADDLGWTDLGHTGSDFHRTPHLDRLAGQGMRFEQAYAASTVCSPTRAALLTGKSPARLRITDWIRGHRRPWARLRVPDWTMQLPLEETTIAELLRGAGYATGHVGKWHLGEADSSPERHGFQHNVGGGHRGHPPSYFSPYGLTALADGPPGEYLTDREADEAIRFIRENRGRPFFLHLAHYAPHTPLQAKPELVAAHAERVRPEARHRNPKYAAMLDSLDQAVGRVTAELEALGLAGDTLVIFTSDNGGLVGPTSNAPLRAGKGSAYEGGVRVPLVVRWPGVVPPGTVSRTPVTTVDLFPTVAEAAGLSIPPELAASLDGRSLVPVLRDPAAPTAARELFWHYPHYHPGGATPHGAIRSGDLKLVEFFEDERVELYDLGRDVGETRDLSAERRADAERLRARLHAWRTAVGAQIPAPNPDHDPARATAGPGR